MLPLQMLYRDIMVGFMNGAHHSSTVRACVCVCVDKMVGFMNGVHHSSTVCGQDAVFGVFRL